MQLRWIASFSGSTLHAATALARGRTLADARLAAELTPPAMALARTAEELAGGDPHRAEALLDHLAAQAAGIENNRQLAEVALTKALDPVRRTAAASTRLAGDVADCEAALARVYPKIADELATRGGPLKLHWEARGPGLLASIGQQTEAGVLADRADVVLVHPALGGGGAAHLPYNSVRIEAVLANPVPSLPEIARLGWLLSQLQLDLPIYGEHLDRRRLVRVACLAMIPPTLAAAANVELVADDATTLREAITAWCPGEDAESVADTLTDWYATYCNRRPPLAVALGALDKMLAGPSSQ